MFSNLKKKEYMESELSDIFLSKSGHQKYTAWVLSGRNHKQFLQCDVSFWRNIQIFRIRLLHLIAFLVKQYTSLIYVK